jgi:hypothetical protein
MGSFQLLPEDAPADRSKSELESTGGREPSPYLTIHTQSLIEADVITLQTLNHGSFFKVRCLRRPNN